MKSWENRRNTYWIIIATVFGLVFAGNQTNNYKNLIGLVLCWMLYIYCFICNNKKVEKQEQKEKEEHQKRIKQELEKKEKKEKQKKERDKRIYELVEYPKIINYIMAKYNRDWEQDLYPKNSRAQIIFIKRQIETDIKYEKISIRNYKDAIERIEDLKKKTRFRYKCEELNREIEIYQTAINYCEENIKNIPEKYEHNIAFYQNEIERYKDQCRKFEQKANDLLQNSPDKIIEAVDYYLREDKEVTQKTSEDYYNDKNTWLKHEEEKKSCLLQAKFDAIKKIETREK